MFTTDQGSEGGTDTGTGSCLRISLLRNARLAPQEWEEAGASCRGKKCCIKGMTARAKASSQKGVGVGRGVGAGLSPPPCPLQVSPGYQDEMQWRPQARALVSYLPL